MNGPEADPYRRFGLIPAKQDAVSWITHLFMHGDFWHLIGNLLILYLAGPFIEDVWGRWMYSAFYLTAGIFASLVFVLRAPDLDIPLIGASGAIAGVMGAFLVRYWNTKIRFFYIFGLIFRGTFDAPAWLMLPMWFCEQLVMASLTDHIGGSGVAYWAHVGGFAFGVGAAFAIKHFRIEETYLHPAIEAKTVTTVVANPMVERAMEAQQAGDGAGALDLLSEEIRRNPGNRDAALALWSLGEEQGRLSLAAPALVALIRNEVRAGEDDLAVDHWRELLAKVPASRVDARLILRISQLLRDRGETAEAVRALRIALLNGGSSLPVAVVLKIADSARSLDPCITRGAVEMALAHPDLVPVERARAMEILHSVN
jgi:membrane associated rhomboid family serine protease